MKRPNILSGMMVAGAMALASCTEEPTAPAAGSGIATPELRMASNTWLTRANMWSSDERWDLATATVKNAAGQSILYAIGGRSSSGGALGTVMAYNVSTNTWNRRASLPRPSYGTNGAGVLNGKIYVSGGCLQVICIGYEPPSKALFVYDPATNTWTRKRDMPVVGAYGVTGVISGRLYVLTRCLEVAEGNSYFDDCEPSRFLRYNRLSDRWSPLRSPSSTYTAGGVIAGRFYAAGGSRLEVYDPATDRWTVKSRPPVAIATKAAGVVLDGELYVIGGGAGYNPNSGGEVRTVLAYDPALDKWTTKATLPSARSGISASRVLVDAAARIEVVGGSRPGNNLQYVP